MEDRNECTFILGYEKNGLFVEKKEKRPIIKDEAADLQEVKRWLNNSEKLGAFSRDKASFVFVVEQFEELRPKNKNV